MRAKEELPMELELRYIKRPVLYSKLSAQDGGQSSCMSNFFFKVQFYRETAFWQNEQLVVAAILKFAANISFSSLIYVSPFMEIPFLKN